MKPIVRLLICALLFAAVGCGTTYQAKPLPFKTPSAYPNALPVAGATVAATAFVDPKEAQNTFGFDIRGAGMLPVEVVFDNEGTHPLEINADQTFLEDQDGNLWPILSRDQAYERAGKYAQPKEIAKKGAYNAVLGAAAGAIIGAAIGIVSGDNVAGTLGKGAAVGAAAGATLGGTAGYASDEPHRIIAQDLQQKSLEAKPIQPGTLAHGFLFFPGEAAGAKRLRLQLVEKDTGKTHVLQMNL